MHFMPFRQAKEMNSFYLPPLLGQNFLAAELKIFRKLYALSDLIVPIVLNGIKRILLLSKFGCCFYQGANLASQTI